MELTGASVGSGVPGVIQRAILESVYIQYRVNIGSNVRLQVGWSLVVGPSIFCGMWLKGITVNRSRTTLKFWSATMFGAAARNFGPVHKFELPTVIADSVPRATRVFSLASVGHVTGHMVSHMVPIARCRPPYWKIFTVNNLATVF